MRLWFPIPASLIVLAVASSSTAASPTPRSFVVRTDPASHLIRADLAVSAQQFIQRNASIPPNVELVARPAIAIGSNTVIRFEQRYQGLTVVSRGAAVAVGADDRVLLATTRIESDLPASVTPSVDAARAASIAQAAAGLEARTDQARLVIWPSIGGGRLAWIVRPAPFFPFPYAPIVAVDAQSAQVLSIENAVRFKNHANMYPINPVQSPGLVDVTLPIPDPNVTPDNDDAISFNCIDAKTTKPVSYGGFTLNVHVCELSSKNSAVDAGVAPAEAYADPDGGDYVQYAPGADNTPGDPFAQLSIFYHTNKAYEFFRGIQPGFKLLTGAYPLYLVSNLMIPGGSMSLNLQTMQDPNAPLDPFSNAFYSGWDPTGGGFDQLMTSVFPDIKGGALFFGQGAKADYSYDGEVIYHEFTHAVVDTTAHLTGLWHLDSQGGSVSPGSMNEAVADLFSAAISGDPAIGEYAAKDMATSSNPNPSAIRNLDNNFSCPKYLAGEVHFDSQFFSAAFWKIRSSLSNPTDQHSFDIAVFTALSSVASGDLGYEDLANAITTAVAGSPLGATVAGQLTQELTNRGVLPFCHRLVEYNGRFGSQAPELGNSFAAGGKTEFAGGATLPWVPGLLQTHVPLSVGAANIHAKFSEMVSSLSSLPISSGTPFKPAFLVNFGAEISFTTSGTLKANTDTVIDATKTTAGAIVWAADIAVPAGATDAYIMVVNKGDRGSNYYDVTFDQTTVGDAGPEAAVDGASPEAAIDAQPDGTTPPTPDASADSVAPQPDAADEPIETEQPAQAADDSGGCGCRTAGADSSRGGVLLGALALAAVLARRRRSSNLRS